MIGITLIIGLLIIFGDLYLERKQGSGFQKVFIPCIGFVNLRFITLIGTILLVVVVFVFNR